MLVLERKVDQVVRIGDDIQVMVTFAGDGRVKLGITAPPEVPVHRQEVYERIHGEQGQAGVDVTD
jgi:carbon storage regulator